MTKNKKRNFGKDHNYRPKLQPPFYTNKNSQFERIRSKMTMKTDGPTSDEISSIDTTSDVVNDKEAVAIGARPVSTSREIKNWLGDYWKQTLIGVGIAVIIFFLGRLVVHHDNHLIEHNKDIEYLKKSDSKQDEAINQLKEKSNDLNTDIRLIEQKIELTIDKPQLQSGKANKK